MKPGFLEDYLDARSSNGRDDVLLTELHFRDTNGDLYKVPIGSPTDGCSSPRWSWLVPGFEPAGTHWFEWVQHDSAYRGTLLIRKGLEYVPAVMTRREADLLLDRSLQLRGMSKVKRKLVFTGLTLGGGRNFRSHANPLHTS